MSDEAFQPRVVPASGEPDRPPSGEDAYPEPGEGDGFSVAHAPTIPLPPRRNAPRSVAPGRDSPPEPPQPEAAPGRRSYVDENWIRTDDGEQRIKPAIPVAQLRRALDSFYATHSADADTDAEADAQATKTAALPSRKRKDKDRGRDKGKRPVTTQAAGAQAEAAPTPEMKAPPTAQPPSAGPSAVPGPRVGGRSAGGSIAQRPMSSPSARTVSAESTAKAQAPDIRAAPTESAARAKPVESGASGASAEAAAPTKAEKSVKPGKAPKAENPAADPAPPRAAQPGRRRAIRLSARPSLRWWLVAIVLALVLAGSAAVLGANLGGRKASAAPPPAPTAAAPDPASGPAVAAAVSWIIDNVGPEHVVACDVTVCGLLRSHGFPASSLITVRTGIADVEQADVVVQTALLRQLAGPRLSTVEASQPLAVFGADAQLAIVQTVALVGPTEYGQQLAADLASRMQAGLALFHNPALTLSPAAQAQLSAGMVDSRICSLLALLVGGHSITVSAFTPPGPGAGPSIPSAGVVISTIDGQPATGGSPAAAALKSLVSAQQAPFEPLSVGPSGIVAEVQQPGAGTTPGTPGTAPAATGLEVIFAQPGPLGLLGGGTQ
ncbi:MAG TPA: hypothetical protein VGX23_16320 [Actinocrinis sp.]|nr:hypothetical protein [Actinocrinis sp.]